MRWLPLLAFLLLPSLAHAQATVVTSCGSTTLTAGTSHFVTVDVNGQSCQSGAGSGAGGADDAFWRAGRRRRQRHDAEQWRADGDAGEARRVYVLAQQTQSDARLNSIGTSYC